jgi:hypothetical protein
VQNYIAQLQRPVAPAAPGGGDALRMMVEGARRRMKMGASIPDAWTAEGLYGKIPQQLLPHMQSEENMRWIMDNPDILAKWNIAEGLKTPMERLHDPAQQDVMESFMRRPAKLSAMYAKQQSGRR